MSYLNILQQSAKFVFYPSIWTIYNDFFSEYHQDVSLMVTLYGIIFLITFTFSVTIFLKWSWPLKKWSQPFKSYLNSYEMILTTKELITITWKVLSATTKVILATEEVITGT